MEDMAFGNEFESDESENSVESANQQVPVNDDNEPDWLGMWSYPDDVAKRRHVDKIAGTPDDGGYVLCWRRCLQCKNPDCVDEATGRPHRFEANERDLWNCPICERDRHCRKRIPADESKRGCHLHGGKTPSGWALPQTKTGEFSKHIKVDSLRRDYEEMLANPALMAMEEQIALYYALVKETTREFGGGISRSLLLQMKQNRDAYKEELRKPPEKIKPGYLKKLDQSLDGLIARGSKQYQIRDDLSRNVEMMARLISARDAHVQNERMVITSDKAYMMLGHVQETFELGLSGVTRTEDDW